MKTALAFDIYGTVIDTAGVVDALTALVGNRAGAFSDRWREKQLELTFRRALMRRYKPFSVCVAESLDHTARQFDLDLAAEDRQTLLGVFGVLPAFSDAPACLEALDSEDFAVYALSNGTRDAVDQLLTTAGIRQFFIDIVSVDEIRTFKPDPAVYHHFLERADVSGNEAWLVSGNPFDVVGAISAGMKGAWIRRNDKAGFDGCGIEPTATVAGLDDLPRAISRR